jgi:hypothetical protein
LPPQQLDGHWEWEVQGLVQKNEARQTGVGWLQVPDGQL